MEFVGKVVETFTTSLNINEATLSGAIDIVVVEHEDGSRHCTPFHVRFGKRHLLRSREKVVTIEINGKAAPGEFYMKVGKAGEVFFVLDDDDDVLSSSPTDSVYAATTPDSPREQPMSAPTSLGLPTKAPPPLGGNTLEIRREKLSRDQKPAVSLLSQQLSSSQYKNESISEIKESGGESPSVTSGSVDSDQVVSEKLRKETPSSMPSMWSTSPSQKLHRLSSSPSMFFDEETSGWSWGWGHFPEREEMEEAEEEKAEEEKAEEQEQVKEPKKEEAEPHVYEMTKSPSRGGWMGSFLGIFRLRSPQPPEDEQKESTEEDEESGGIALTDLLEEAGRKSRSSLVEDEEEKMNPMGLVKQLGLHNLEMSLCGKEFSELTKNKGQQLAVHQPHLLGKEEREVFSKHRVSVDEFMSDPLCVFRPDVLFRVAGQILPLELLVPYLVHALAFHQALSIDELGSIMRKQLEVASLSISEEKKEDTPPPQPQPQQQQRKHWASWLWGETPEAEKAKEAIHRKRRRRRRTLRPPPGLLEMLHLEEGSNVITFTVTSQLQGVQIVGARLFLWKSSDKLVVSDIDGTITRSDRLGLILPALGRDWSHVGVTDLFSAIARNGYRFLYLSSRAVGQADSTRSYIQHLRQGEQTLPDGPILLSPDGLVAAFTREVVVKQPQKFKIPALKDVCRLFDKNPFYAGFGNRRTDSVSYLAVGVPKGRIFTIRPNGRVEIHSLSSSKSGTTYSELRDLVNEMFPSLSVQKVEEEFNSYQYWRTPIPKLE